jgi:hypothetical protein
VLDNRPLFYRGDCSWTKAQFEGGSHSCSRWTLTHDGDGDWTLVGASLFGGWAITFATDTPLSDWPYRIARLYFVSSTATVTKWNGTTHVPVTEDDYVDIYVTCWAPYVCDDAPELLYLTLESDCSYLDGLVAELYHVALDEDETPPGESDDSRMMRYTGIITSATSLTSTINYQFELTLYEREYGQEAHLEVTGANAQTGQTTSAVMVKVPGQCWYSSQDGSGGSSAGLSHDITSPAAITCSPVTGTFTGTMMVRTSTDPVGVDCNQDPDISNQGEADVVIHLSE